MNILLVYPRCLEERIHTEDVMAVPMGLYSVGAILAHENHQVEIVNGYEIHPDDPSAFENIIRDKSPHIIGFSVLHANRWGAINMAGLAKKVNPDIVTVFGGVGITFLWELMLSHFFEIDYAVMGEGEMPMKDLVSCIEKVYPQRPEHDVIEKIDGIAFRKEDRVVRTADAPLVKNLDDLPSPARYFNYQHVSLSRGCPGNCTFCGSPGFWRHRVRFRSSSCFVDELETLYQRGIGFFYFSDDMFTLKKHAVIDICRQIIKRRLNISWAAISQVNYISEEMLYWMRKAGCAQISFGVESGNEAIRAELNKHISVERIRDAFSLTTKYGILARAYFIYGCPGETWDTIQDTIDLMHEIKPLSTIFYILDVFPGTALYEDFKKRYSVDDSIWLKPIEDIMYFEFDPRMSQERILKFGNKLRTTFYQSLPTYIDGIELIDMPELYPYHSDFLSRLAMTLSHGDYAAIEAIPDKQLIAERLYRKALQYRPDHRAFLGLGIIHQKKGAFHQSIRILSDAIKYYPESESLNICLGISFMNLNNFDAALDCFMKFPESHQAMASIANCYRAMGRHHDADVYMNKIEKK